MTFSYSVLRVGGEGGAVLSARTKIACKLRTFVIFVIFEINFIFVRKRPTVLVGLGRLAVARRRRQPWRTEAAATAARACGVHTLIWSHSLCAPLLGLRPAAAKMRSADVSAMRHGVRSRRKCAQQRFGMRPEGAAAALGRRARAPLNPCGHHVRCRALAGTQLPLRIEVILVLSSR